jgi:hypothetical protein
VRGKASQNQFQYLVDALDLIDLNCRLFFDGFYPAFRIVGVQLRILLCDTNRRIDKSLASRVIEDLRLHPMKSPLTEERLSKEHEEINERFPGTGPVLTNIPHGITGIPGQKRYVDIFDTSAERIPLSEWLD